MIPKLTTNETMFHLGGSEKENINIATKFWVSIFNRQRQEYRDH